MKEQYPKKGEERLIKIKIDINEINNNNENSRNDQWERKVCSFKRSITETMLWRIQSKKMRKKVNTVPGHILNMQ